MRGWPLGMTSSSVDREAAGLAVGYSRLTPETTRTATTAQQAALRAIARDDLEAADTAVLGLLQASGLVDRPGASNE